MKIIKYKLLSAEIDNEQIFLEKSMGWNEVNEEIAKQEAYNGEYTIEEDGQPEPEAQPTESERIAELEEALALLLSGVTG